MQHPAGALGIEPPAHPLLKSVPQAADTHPAPQVPLRSRSPHLHLTCSPAPGADPGPQSPGVSGDTGSREAIAPGASHMPVGQGLQTQAALQSEFLLPGQSVLGGFKTKSSFIQQTPRTPSAYFLPVPRLDGGDTGTELATWVLVLLTAGQTLLALAAGWFHPRGPLFNHPGDALLWLTLTLQTEPAVWRGSSCPQLPAGEQ